MTDAGQNTEAVNKSRGYATTGLCHIDPSSMDLAMIMLNHGTEAARDIGRLYMTLHKISIINHAREAKCNLWRF